MSSPTSHFPRPVRFAFRFSLLCLLVATPLLFGQVESGSIVGTVRDASGAVVANAQVTVLNTETAMFAAEDTLVQVRFARLQALVSLYGALGGGWQSEKTTDG